MLLKAMNSLLFGTFKFFIRNLFNPIDYTRSREIPAIIKVSGIKEDKQVDGLRILDIGSPQILTLTLAKMNPSWNVVYVNLFDDENEEMTVLKRLSGVKNIQILKADATQSDFLKIEKPFDYIFSCSVFEHIYPEANGDEIAIRNIKGLLTENGNCTLSVPYYLKAFNEYVDGPVYSHDKSGEGKTFFQRFYDEESLRNRIIEPSSLKNEKTLFVGERFFQKNNIHKRLGKTFHKLGFRLLFGRLFGILSVVFMEESTNYKNLQKPYLAVIKLVK